MNRCSALRTRQNTLLIRVQFVATVGAQSTLGDRYDLQWQVKFICVYDLLHCVNHAFHIMSSHRFHNVRREEDFPAPLIHLHPAEQVVECLELPLDFRTEKEFFRGLGKIRVNQVMTIESLISNFDFVRRRGIIIFRKEAEPEFLQYRDFHLQFAVPPSGEMRCLVRENRRAEITNGDSAIAKFPLILINFLTPPPTAGSPDSDVLSPSQSGTESMQTALQSCPLDHNVGDDCQGDQQQSQKEKLHGVILSETFRSDRYPEGDQGRQRGTISLCMLAGFWKLPFISPLSQCGMKRIK